MFASNPAGNGALINLELFSCNLLGAEVGNEVLVNSVHADPPYGNTHIVCYGNTDLQGYGSTRNTRAMEFKDRLKAARKHAKLNQTELAERAGLTQTSISDLERGKSKATAFVAQIASVCGVSPLWLAEGIGEMLKGIATFDDFVAAQDRVAFNPFISEGDRLTLIDHELLANAAQNLAALASPRSQSALAKIAEAAYSGRLTEDDILLLETIANRMAANPTPSPAIEAQDDKKTSHTRIKERLRQHDSDPQQ